MKVIDKIRKMSSSELASLLHYELTSSDCSDCILNNLDHMAFCNNGNNDRNCTDSIKAFLENSRELRLKRNK